MVNEIILGNCLKVLKTYPENHFTSIITDPPYGLSFMGKKWDYDVPSIEIWKECLRVLKPGGTMLCFAGSRTQHRMAVNIEDAGFLIKDCLMWIYGSGFPKATDISKQLDKVAGTERIEGKRIWEGGKRSSGILGDNEGTQKRVIFDIPVSNYAKQFDGYKSHALKPAYEPIIMAMKPNEGTYAENAMKWGVSGLNIEAGRIEMSFDDFEDYKEKRKSFNNTIGKTYSGFQTSPNTNFIQMQGRFPANILFDEEAAKMLGEPSRFFYCAKASSKERNEGCEELEEKEIFGDISLRQNGVHGQTGKANKPLMSKNHHPTVKPLKLMEYLIKLIMPPKDGLILDPFAGSGTTILAAKRLGFNAIGIEMSEEYHQIALKRVESFKYENSIFEPLKEKKPQKPQNLDLLELINNKQQGNGCYV